MNTIVLDDCLYHLYCAQEALNDYTEIDSYMEIFEAENPEVAEQVEQNEKSKKTVIDHLKSAGNAILNVIRNIISSIQDFFRKINMDEAERQAYEAFKKQCANDPSLKNKKVTVLDFRRYTEDYQKILAEAEAAERELAAGRDYPIDNIVSKITEFCSGGSKAMVTAVGCEAALNFASSSRDAAKKMLQTLQNDEKMQQRLVDAIGKKEAKRFEKDMKSLGKRFSLKRKVMQLKGTASSSLEEAIVNTLQQVSDLCDAGIDISGKIQSNDPTKPGIVNKARMVKSIAGNREELKADLKNIGRSSDMIRRAYSNDQIRQGIGEVLKTSGETNKAARRTYKDLRKADKKQARDEKRASKRKRHFKTHDQDIWDSIVGTNDNKSTYNRKFVDHN